MLCLFAHTSAFSKVSVHTCDKGGLFWIFFALARILASGLDAKLDAEIFSCDVQESRAEVLSNHDDALEALAVSAWPQMAASTHAQLQLFISLLTDISRDKVILQTLHPLRIP